MAQIIHYALLAVDLAVFILLEQSIGFFVTANIKHKITFGRDYTIAYFGVFCGLFCLFVGIPGVFGGVFNPASCLIGLLLLAISGRPFLKGTRHYLGVMKKSSMESKN